MPRIREGLGGFHQGIEAAMQTQTDFIALLDNDILLEHSKHYNPADYLKG